MKAHVALRATIIALLLLAATLPLLARIDVFHDAVLLQPVFTVHQDGTIRLHVLAAVREDLDSVGHPAETGGIRGPPQLCMSAARPHADDPTTAPPTMKA